MARRKKAKTSDVVPAEDKQLTVVEGQPIALLKVAYIMQGRGAEPRDWHQSLSRMVPDLVMSLDSAAECIQHGAIGKELLMTKMAEVFQSGGTIRSAGGARIFRLASFEDEERAVPWEYGQLLPSFAKEEGQERKSRDRGVTTMNSDKLDKPRFPRIKRYPRTKKKKRPS